jgi:hypothetical protein
LFYELLTGRILNLLIVHITDSISKNVVKSEVTATGLCVNPATNAIAATASRDPISQQIDKVGRVLWNFLPKYLLATVLVPIAIPRIISGKISNIILPPL